MIVCEQVSAWNRTTISVRDVPADLIVGWPLSSAFSYMDNLLFSATDS